jgi:hypothetical protein
MEHDTLFSQDKLFDILTFDDSTFSTPLNTAVEPTSLYFALAPVAANVLPGNMVYSITTCDIGTFDEFGGKLNQRVIVRNGCPVNRERYNVTSRGHRKEVKHAKNLSNLKNLETSSVYA